MELTAHEDIDAPIETVFAAVTDFNRFERALLRRDAQIQRIDSQDAPGKGMRWQIDFDLRGKPRKADLEITGFDAPEHFAVTGRGPGITTLFDVQLIALSPRRTRIEMRADIRPNSVSGRVFLQPLRLARAKMLKRFRKGVHDFARRIDGGGPAPGSDPVQNRAGSAG